MLEEKMERAVIGEALVAKCEVDFLKLEEVIPEAKHEIIVLVEEENQSQNNLKTWKRQVDCHFGLNLLFILVCMKPMKTQCTYWSNIVDFVFGVFIVLMLPLLPITILTILFLLKRAFEGQQQLFYMWASFASRLDAYIVGDFVKKMMPWRSLQWTWGLTIHGRRWRCLLLKQLQYQFI